ncbi:MAG: lysozyme [Candidatus Liberibacter europaeus]|uniref:Lysozyme n=1 Tax=Candidatus Liberibacter europaeus TaxID=744859 RepID=A0A2T4VYE4_9HYPH|nr:lysozyme [Candidatus Liberibacter europaeus]PTL86791.1 MAG: lysozyme [Candidatus Liberibacter europaeus]
MTTIPSLLIDVIKNFEGLRLKAYRCPAGVLTIGYGHTGFDVCEDMNISEQHADELLILDVSKCLNQVLNVSPILINANENRISAIGDFVFNLGIGRYKASTFRKRVDEEDWDEASKECTRWVFAGGRKLKGLVARREIEAALLLQC